MILNRLMKAWMRDLTSTRYIMTSWEDEGWNCKSFIDSSQKYLNNEYIVIKRVKKAYDECSSVFTQNSE